MSSERKETVFPCKNCDKSYVYSRDLARHRRKIHGDDYIKTPKSLTKIKVAELKKSWRCKICDKQYQNLWFLRNHVKVIHKRTKIRSKPKMDRMDSIVEKMVQMHQKIRKSECKIPMAKIEENKEKEEDKMHKLVEKMVQMNKKIVKSGMTHHPEVINDCMLCNQSFSNERMVRMHQTMVHQIKL